MDTKTQFLTQGLFSGCTSLVIIEIPSYVASISTRAFEYCSKLKTVTIGSNVTTIYDGAFKFCVSLESFDFSHITSIRDAAFIGCSSLVTISLPKITTTGFNYQQQFEFCTKLTSVTYYNGVITTIPSRVFAHCYMLSEISFNENITTIKESAFYYCKALTSIVLPNVTTIEGYAFRSCRSLKEVTFTILEKDTNKMLTIGTYSFQYCPIESLSFKDCNVTLNTGSFAHCQSLLSLEVSTRVYVNLNNLAFINCSKFATITLNSDNDLLGSSYGMKVANNVLYKIEDNDTTLILYPPCKDGAEFVPDDGCNIIDSYSFSYVYNLKKFTFKNQTIKTRAFSPLYFIQEVIITNVTAITDYCFYACPSLKRVSLSSELRSIGGYAFGNCDSLTTVTIPPTILILGTNIFAYCCQLEKITFLPLNSKGYLNSKLEIPNSFCYNCYSLKSVEFPVFTVSIGGSAFRNCIAIQSITFYYGWIGIGKFKIFIPATHPEHITFYYGWIGIGKIRRP